MIIIEKKTMVPTQSTNVDTINDQNICLENVTGIDETENKGNVCKLYVYLFFWNQYI